MNSLEKYHQGLRKRMQNNGNSSAVWKELNYQNVTDGNPVGNDDELSSRNIASAFNDVPNPYPYPYPYPYPPGH